MSEMWLIVLALLLVLLTTTTTTINGRSIDSVATQTQILSIPIQVRSDGEQYKEVNYSLYNGDDIESSVSNFCNTHTIPVSQCHLLLQRVYELLQQQMNTKLMIGNSFQRVSEAYFNEVRNSASVLDIEPYELIVSDSVRRIAVLHSCSFIDQSFDVLSEMVGTFISTGAIDSIDALWILNYGEERQVDRETFRSLSSKIQMVQVSSSCNNFEIPSIRSIEALAKVLDKDVQVLYLHTKGTSYADIPETVHEWRRYMMYFLVELHKSCFHLLSSGFIDVVGMDLRQFPDGQKFILGNFWWTTAEYLRSLPTFHAVDKYSSEKYILSRQAARVFLLHNTSVVIGEESYPRSAYVNAQPDCLNANICLF